MFKRVNNKLTILVVIIFLLLLISPVVFADKTNDESNILDNKVILENDLSNDNSIKVDDNNIHKEDVKLKKDNSNTIYVSPNGGGSGERISDATDIDDAISNLNDNGTIYLTADNENNLYQLYNVGINLYTLKNTTKNVNIVGDVNRNISLESNFLMFDIGEVNLTIKNVNLVNSYSDYYLGVIISQLSNVSFINCSFINYTGAYKDSSFIYTIYSNITFTNCTFKDSNLSNSSSFIRNHVNRVLGEFMNDFPIYYYSSSNYKFINNIFTNNTAGSNGNLLFFDCCDKVELYNNRFEYNTAVNGLFRSYIGYNDSIVKNSFKNNNAKCLFLSYSEGIVQSNIFTNNTAPMAPAILMVQGKYNLTSNNFINNHADTYGGAIVNLAYHYVNITNCLFNNNSAVYGGAIYNVYDCLNITYSNFTLNNASYGGALYYLFNDTMIGQLDFNPNIVFNDPNLITNSLFESNTANEGSVLYVIKSNIHFNENAVFNKDVTENLLLSKKMHQLILIITGGV